jgi:signal peptidase I
MNPDAQDPLAPLGQPARSAPAPVPAPSAGPPGRDEEPGKPVSTTRTVVEWALTIGAALLAALIIKTFVLQAFYIPSVSMVPTLEINDRVLVNKLSYRLHPIHRGDIVVFKRPPGEQQKINDLIKRVIGLPNDTVQTEAGHIFVNGQQLNEPYLPAGTVSLNIDQPVHVPPGYYWVMGDNRTNSADSRSFGPIPKSLIVGRAFVKVWPISSITFF